MRNNIEHGSILTWNDIALVIGNIVVEREQTCSLPFRSKF